MKRIWNDRAARLTLVYVVAASSWMLFTNQLLAHLARNLQLLGWLDTYNAWFFIAFTAPLLYLERRQADRGLKLLATIVTASDDAILSGTLDGKITSWNRGAEAIYGHTAGEVVGRPLSFLLPVDEDARAALGEVLARIGRGERIRHLEALHRRKNGEPVDIALSVSPITDPSGQVTGLCAVGRDVTRHRRMERQLRESERRLSTLISNLPGMVYRRLDDEAWTMEYISQGSLPLTGHAPADFTNGRISYRELIHAADREPIHGEIRRSLDMGAPFQLTYRLLTPTGEVRWVWEQGRGISGADGTPQAIEGFVVDVTTRRQAEQALRMAEVGKLASGLVHEIRNPLNAMRMQVAVIRGKLNQMTDDGGGLAGQILESLDQEVLRIERLASEFLAYGRPVSDKAETIEPSAIVQDLAEFVRPELAQDGIEVVTADGPGAAELQVKMDESKLRQVLLNLLENARQAMPEGGRLTLGCARDPLAGVRIQVTDTGGGILPENLERVFDVFFSTKSAGTGLGLAIVKQTVEAAGGRILVDSQVGEGTRFEINLPLAVTAGAASGDPGGPAGPPTTEDGAS